MLSVEYLPFKLFRASLVLMCITHLVDPFAFFCTSACEHSGVVAVGLSSSAWNLGETKPCLLVLLRICHWVVLFCSCFCFFFFFASLGLCVFLGIQRHKNTTFPRFSHRAYFRDNFEKYKFQRRHCRVNKFIKASCTVI